jgi:hypothetical protein
MHPEYLSTKHASRLAAPVYAIQHHWAHVLSCMAENEVEPPALGVSWDGTGYGTDGTIWDGESCLHEAVRLNALHGSGSSACLVGKWQSGNRAEPPWAFCLKFGVTTRWGAWIFRQSAISPKISCG